MSGPVNDQHPPQMRAEAEERRQPDVLKLHQAIARELSDPRDGAEPTPVWLLFGFFLLTGWGGWYIALHSGRFDSTEYNENTMTAAATVATTPVTVDPLATGKRVFNNCIQCHQSDGKGVPDVYPPLGGSEWVAGDERVLSRILLHGLQGNVTVQGKVYNGQMPAWGKLKDDQIAAVLTYVRASFGNHAPAVSPDTIAAIRKETQGRDQSWSEAELKAVPAK